MSTIVFSTRLNTHLVQFTIPGQPHIGEFQRFVPLHDVLITMERQGGGFHSRLAEAWLHADKANSTRLRFAFGDNLGDYAERVPESLRLTHAQVFGDASLVKAA